MANAYAINFNLQSSTHPFSAIWKLTRTMKAAGWTVVGHYDGTNKYTLSGTGGAGSGVGTPASNANDRWGNNGDPLADTYGSPVDLSSTYGWIILRGPSTIKLSFTTAPGDLLRGESVTQATSGATGELLGTVWDSSGSTGWAVIMPRTGTFDNSNVVTGDISGESFTPTAYVEYAREVMFNKNNNTTAGTIYYICADVSGEATSLFSYLAESAGCTGSAGPGMGGTGNSFPSIAMNVFGAAGSVSNQNWFATTSGYTTFGQSSTINATPSAGVSADGSFFVTAYTAGIKGFVFTRCDNTEPGDIDPYVWIGTGTAATTTYTNNTTVTATPNTLAYSVLSSNSSSVCFGYIGRSTTRDKAVAFSGKINANISYFYAGVNARLHSSPQATGSTPLIKEQLNLYSVRSTEVWYKGIARWYFILSQGNEYDTYDSLTYMCVSSRSGTVAPASILGLLDGVTTPSSS